MAFCEVAVLGLTRSVLIAAVSLERAETRIGQAFNEIAQRLAFELEGIRVRERDQRSCRDGLLNGSLGCDLATLHIGMAASTDQTLEGITAIGAVAGGDQCVGHMGPPKVASGSCPHVLPRDLKALLVESANHLLGTALTIDLPRRGPGTKCLRHRAREPGQQMALARAVLCRQFDTRNDVDTALGAGCLRLSDSLKRVVIGQSQHLDPTLRGELDDEARSMTTVRACRMRVQINSGRRHSPILLGTTARETAYDACMSEDVPTGRRVLLPKGSVGSLMVFVNGKQMTEGVDFAVDGDALVFTAPLHVGRKTSFLGRLQMTTVGVGVYEKIDKVDVHATGTDGSFRVFSDLVAELDA